MRRHILLAFAGFTLLFSWLYLKPIVTHSYVADSDMYEFFLPVFKAPITTWSTNEFAGMPAFADPQDTALYPVHFLFARILGSWTGFLIAAYVLTATFTYVYVSAVTRSTLAALFAALMFGLSEAMMERIAHVTTIHAVAWFPLILLAVDRLRGAQPLRWMVIGTAAMTSCMLGGHPQIVLFLFYTVALYALAGGVIERAGWRYWVAGLAMAALAVLLTAVKVLPVLETRELTARQALDFGAFISKANTPAQLWSMLFPAVVHDGREAPTYVALGGLIFAIVGMTVRDWRARFWIAIGIVALLVGVGDATPVAALVYRVPMYDNFRVGARHLILTSFALCMLAGIGVAALQAGRASWRRVLGAALVVVALVLVGYWRLSLPGGPELESGEGNWPQLLLVAAAAAVTVAFARRPQTRIAVTALVVVLMVDSLHAVAWDITAVGLDSTTVPAAAIEQPSVHAAALAARLRPQQQRLLAPEGGQLDAVVPAAFARLWDIPIAGGYGPMLLARHSELAMMGTNGSIDPLALSDDNSALDILAVRYLAMRVSDLNGNGEDAPFHLPVGPPECGQHGSRRVSYALPRGVRVTGITLVAQLRCSEDVPQGTEAARLVLRGANQQVERRLVAGVDIAEAGLSDPNLRRRARHSPAAIVDPTAATYSYRVRWDLPSPIADAALDVEVNTPGWLEIDRLTISDDGGGEHGVSVPGLLLDADRWREVSRFETSRLTDRGSDQSSDREERYVVFENARARPRAWVVNEVVPVDDRAALQTIHASRFNDGRRFDPATTALVAGDVAAQTFSSAGGRATVTSIGDGAVDLDVDAPSGGYLVLSESYYPGWTALVDGASATVHPTDYSLQGVIVPPGRHQVAFRLQSPSLRHGRIISLTALVVLIVLAVIAFRPQTRSARARA